MCCIIHRLKDSKEISKENIEKIVKKNPDGWGISYINDDGNLIIEKSMDMNLAFDKIKEVESQNKEFLFHARYATHGEKNVANCHPFEIHDGVMFHNGKMEVAPWRKEMSDSWHFSKKVTKLLFKKKKSLTDVVDKYFKNIIKDSRLAFMFNGGSVVRHGNWHEIDGSFYSKLDWKITYCGGYNSNYWGEDYNRSSRNYNSNHNSQDRYKQQQVKSQVKSIEEIDEFSSITLIQVDEKLMKGGLIDDKDIEDLDINSIQLLLEKYPEKIAEYLFNELNKED